MQIIVNGAEAVLKKGTSIEYVSENRLFSGADDFTLSISLPLKDCPENRAIFGYIDRADVIAKKVIFDCELRDRNFSKFGSLVVNEISGADIKAQFLEGRSAQNFSDTLDNILISDLDLGLFPGKLEDYPNPYKAWDPLQTGGAMVALPWVNESYPEIINNLADCNDEGVYSWNESTTGLSWQLYLLELTKRICSAIGYTADFSVWEQDERLKYLLVCNTLPYEWGVYEFRRALPQWSVREYFEKLELFLGAQFDFDFRGRHIDFFLLPEKVKSLPMISLDDVTDDHSSAITTEEDSKKCEYVTCRNLQYKEVEHNMLKFYSCPWMIKDWIRPVRVFNTLRELLATCGTDEEFYSAPKRQPGSYAYEQLRYQLLYAKDVDAYFIYRVVGKFIHRAGPLYFTVRYRYECRPVNLLGPRIVSDDENTPTDEIEFVPACIDETEDAYGRLLFLSPGAYDEQNQEESEELESIDADGLEDFLAQYPVIQPTPAKMIEQGEKEKSTAYYDNIFVAWWDGSTRESGKLPHPHVENIEILPDWSNYRSLHFNLRLNDAGIRSGAGSDFAKIDPKQKRSFNFFYDTIPDPKSLFLIHGKRYVCEKITATFTEKGRSQLLKGDFYPVID